MRSRLAVAVVLAGGVLFASGCFVFQGFSWDTVNVKPGKSANASITVTPFSTTKQKDYPFVLIGTPTNGDFFLGDTRKWDVKGHFGGPQSMLKDQTLANLVVNNDYCASGGFDPGSFSSTDWTAVRTQKAFSNKGKTSKTALEKIQMKASNNPSVTGTAERMEFITGGWTDDGDGTPESAASSDDSYVCTGGTVTNMVING